MSAIVTLFFTLLSSLIVSTSAFASNPDDAFFDSLKNENFDIRHFETCDPDGKSGDGGGLQTPLSYKPDGLGEYPQPPACSADNLQNLILSASSESVRKESISKFFDQCGEHLKSFNHGSRYAMALFTGARYAYCNHPRVRRIYLHFNDGLKLGGVIAIQPPDKNGVNQPRPLVIYKCGVFCETEDASTKLMVMHMFDQSPFNVIAVGNNTTADFTADNKYIALGGYDEGMQLLRLAKMIRNSPLAKITTSIHVIGMSLGGHAALMSSYLNEHNLDTMNVPYYSSTMALCPAVDLKASVDYLFADNLRGKVSREVLAKNIRQKMADSPLLKEVYRKINEAKANSEVPGIIATYASGYYSQRPSEWALPPLNRTPIRDVDSLWSLNNFHSYAASPINTPTFAIAAEDDWVVEPQVNSIKLSNTLEKSNLQTSLKVVVVPNGNHCAFAPVYGWDTISALYSSYVMSHSPEMLARRHQVKQEIDTQKLFAGALALKSGEKYVRATLEFHSQSKTATLRAKIWGSDSWIDKGCLALSVYTGTSKCLREASLEVPISVLGEWARVPSTQSEAEQLTRWANFNVRYLTADGKPIIDGTVAPSVLVWNEY